MNKDWLHEATAKRGNFDSTRKESRVVMIWVMVKNPNGNILAAFPDRGQAVNFCHTFGHSEKWIKDCEVEIKEKGKK